MKTKINELLEVNSYNQEYKRTVIDLYKLKRQIQVSSTEIENFRDRSIDYEKQKELYLINHLLDDIKQYITVNKEKDYYHNGYILTANIDLPLVAEEVHKEKTDKYKTVLQNKNTELKSLNKYISQVNGELEQEVFKLKEELNKIKSIRTNVKHRQVYYF